jgi:hypothetical protein
MTVEGIRAGIGVAPPDQLRKIRCDLVLDLDLDALQGAP